MRLQYWRLAAIMLTAAGMGTAFCHLLELPAKMRYDAATYAMLQRTLYRYFGPTGGAAEFGATVTTVILAWRLRRLRAFRLTAGAAIALLLTQLLFLALVVPAGVRMQEWPIDDLPADWTRWRDQWEYAHATRAGLMMAALGMLALSVVRQVADTDRDHEAPDY